MEKYTGNGNKLYTCFVDFAKAFDTVMYSGLFYKLVELGISGPFYNVLKNMYDTNYVSVLTGQILTDDIVPEVGVRQGDNLSPNLFRIYINDLPNIFDSNDDQVTLGDAHVSCLLYADDLVLFSTTENGLQNCLNKLSAYCDKNCLTVNLKKTKILVFCKNGKRDKTKFFF